MHAFIIDLSFLQLSKRSYQVVLHLRDDTDEADNVTAVRYRPKRLAHTVCVLTFSAMQSNDHVLTRF